MQEVFRPDPEKCGYKMSVSEYHAWSVSFSLTLCDRTSMMETSATFSSLEGRQPTAGCVHKDKS